MEGSVEAYASSASREMELRCNGVFSGNPQTVYLGGGTPSVFPARHIAAMLHHVELSGDVECTVEANPESIDGSWLENMLALGVNRLSIGVQALDDRLLYTLGRLHTAEQARLAVKMARTAGFRNISIDLMFGIPGQTFSTWKQTLEEATSFGVEHISAYSLGLEEDTPFFEMSRHGGLTIPDSTETADMYLYLSEKLECHGYRRYEISNFALLNYECRHNRGYWNFSPYLGIGVSAHSFDGVVRRWNTADIYSYMERCGIGNSPPYEEEIIDSHIRAMETLLLSLRTTTGLDMETFLVRFAVNGENIRYKIEQYIRERLMERDEKGYVRLTGRGMLISDEILGELAMEVDENDPR